MRRGRPSTEPEWPTVDFIIGNPPFLGGNRIRQELGGDYVERLFALYDGRVPAFADLCCYWFEKARAHIAAGKCKRAGLLATQGIRGGANREVLKRIKDTGNIFWAESDCPWILDGANVHVSMVGFDNGTEKVHVLDGQTVAAIKPNLTSCADITTATIIAANQGICFMGPSPKAPFDMDAESAAVMLADKGNPNGRPNADVVRPVMSAVDIAQTPRGLWTIDFALMPFEEAAQYEKPFEYVRNLSISGRVGRLRLAKIRSTRPIRASDGRSRASSTTLSAAVGIVNLLSAANKNNPKTEDRKIVSQIFRTL